MSDFSIYRGPEMPHTREMKTSLNRRALLRGTGVAIALPMLEAMIPLGRAATKSTRPVKRFVCLSNNYGVYQKAFFPDLSQSG